MLLVGRRELDDDRRVAFDEGEEGGVVKRRLAWSGEPLRLSWGGSDSRRRLRVACRRNCWKQDESSEPSASFPGENRLLTLTVRVGLRRRSSLSIRSSSALQSRSRKLRGRRLVSANLNAREQRTNPSSSGSLGGLLRLWRQRLSIGSKLGLTRLVLALLLNDGSFGGSSGGGGDGCGRSEELGLGGDGSRFSCRVGAAAFADEIHRRVVDGRASCALILESMAADVLPVGAGVASEIGRAHV